MTEPVADAKILIVEDDLFFRRVLQKRLESEGYTVLVAADGREGMKAIVDGEPDVVISDWMMPEVDGLELCQSVKTGLGEAAPYFILLTAKGEVDDKLLGLRTGADDYMVKPCDHGELVARVRAGLRIVRLTQRLRAAAADAAAAPRTLPVCDRCGRARDGNDAWLPLASYVERRWGIRATAETCSDCDYQELRDGTSGP